MLCITTVWCRDSPHISMQCITVWCRDSPHITIQCITVWCRDSPHITMQCITVWCSLGVLVDVSVSRHSPSHGRGTQGTQKESNSRSGFRRMGKLTTFHSQSWQGMAPQRNETLLVNNDTGSLIKRFSHKAGSSTTNTRGQRPMTQEVLSNASVTKLVVQQPILVVNVQWHRKSYQTLQSQSW